MFWRGGGFGIRDNMVQIIGLATARHYSVYNDLLIATALEMLKKLELQLHAVETSATPEMLALDHR